MNTDTLAETLRLHQEWLDDPENGNPANLSEADLLTIRKDIESVLDASPAEVPGFLAALREGRIDGTVYSGECCCLADTLDKLRGCKADAVPGLRSYSRRPAERWFLAIRPGHRPENSPIAALTAEWIEAWLARQSSGRKSTQFSD